MQILDGFGYRAPALRRRGYGLGGDAPPIIVTPPSGGSALAYIAADGAWSPHYNGATAPAATYDGALGRVLYAYESGQVGIFEERKPALAIYDGSSWRTVFAGSVGLASDDHGVPAIATHPVTGQACVFYGSHNTAQYQSWEVPAGSGSFVQDIEWPTVSGLAADGTTAIDVGFSYPHPMWIGSDFWLSFARTYSNYYGPDVIRRVLAIRRATGFDASGIPTGWTDTELLDCGDMGGITGLGPGSRVYHGQNVIEGGLIYVPVSVTDSGDSYRKHPGVIVFDPATGQISNAAGTRTDSALPIDWPTYRDHYAVTLTGDGEESGTPALAIDGSGDLHMVYREGVAGSGALTMMHRTLSGGVWSAATSTGVVMQNAFDAMSIRAISGGLEALYVNDVGDLALREGAVWRKTWSTGGSWTSGTEIWAYDPARPARGRPYPVFNGTDNYAFVMAEKSPGTGGAPGDPFYGQHRAALWGAGGFVERTPAAPTAPTLYPATVKAGLSAFAGYAFIPVTPDDPAPVMSLTDDAGGMFVLADDDRSQFPRIMGTGTQTVGTHSIGLRLTNAFGITTDVAHSVTVTDTFEPEDLTGTKFVWDSRDPVDIRTRTTGDPEPPRPGHAFYRWFSRYGASRRIEGKISGQWPTWQTDALGGYVQAGPLNSYATLSENAAFYLNPAWCIAFGVTVDADAPSDPVLICNGTVGASGRMSLRHDGANWVFQIGSSSISAPASRGEHHAVIVGQTAAGEIVLSVDGVEVTASGFATVASGTTHMMFATGTSAAAANVFKGKLRSMLLVKDACPDAAGRADLAAWLAV